jgi:hypothetical protein
MSDTDVAPEPWVVAHLYRDATHARRAIEALEGAGVGPSAISLVSRSTTQAEELEHATGASDDLQDATEHRHRWQDVVDWLGRLESYAVPSFAGVMGTGSLWNDIARAADQRGAITGALVGLGIDVDDAKRFEESVREGQILVVVHGEQARLNLDELDAILRRFE